jgi:nucleotide-binding universal stress UspA family protein
VTSLRSSTCLNQMLLTPKVITVFLDPSPSGKRRAEHAAVLARRWRAHLIGVYLAFAGIRWPSSMNYVRGDEGIEEVMAYSQRFETQPETTTHGVGQHFRTLCAEMNVSCEFHAIGRERSAAEALNVAFLSDLAVVGRPEPNGLPDNVSVTRLLLESGSPVLIVPNDWNGETIGSRVLVGWNASRAARRAIGDAMSFIVAAKHVTVLFIDQNDRHPPSNTLRAEIASYLDRHGAHGNFEHIPRNGDSIGAALLGYAKRDESDLLVVGAYGHARAREIIFGGTTRMLLEQTSMPTFFSR